MNSAVEQGIKDFLAAQLGAASTSFGAGDERLTLIGCTIAGVKVSIHCNVAQDILPEVNPYIVIGALDLNHLVGALYKPAIRIDVSTPMRVEGITETTHRAICAAVRGIWEEANVDALDAAILAAAGCSARSWFLEGPKATLADDRWQWSLTVNLCLVEQ